MFGYIIANKKALNAQQADRYQGAYCGLCEALRSEYGLAARMSLSYDMVFLVLTVNALYEHEEKCFRGRCFVHPFRSRPRIFTQAVEYAADLSVVLTYEKLLDDVSDDNSTPAKLALKRLQGSYKKACAKMPQKAEKISSLLQKLYAAEKRQADIDELANLFGDVMAEVFSFKNDRWGRELCFLGEALGRFIYVLDAYADFEKDKKKGRFNPLESADDEEILQVLMGEVADIFEHMPIVQDAELLRHIIYSGVWLRYNIQKEREGKKRERSV